MKITSIVCKGLLGAAVVGSDIGWAQSETAEAPESSPSQSQTEMQPETKPEPKASTLTWERFSDAESPLAKMARNMIIDQYKTDPAFRIERFDAARFLHHDGDASHAIAIFTDLAEHAQHTPSMRWLASMAYRGEGQEENATLGYEWFKKAALAGDVEAMAQTGGLAYEGVGTEQSYSTARHWFLHAADRGSNDADETLLKMFDEGQGGPVDKKMAMVFGKRLAKSFEPAGLYYMGIAYRDADRVEQDLDEARRMLEAAMEYGHPNAEAALAAMTANKEEQQP